MSCGVDLRHGSDPLLRWLWCRLVAAVLIRPQAWEPPYAMGAALEKVKRPKKKKKKKRSVEEELFLPKSILCSDRIYRHIHGANVRWQEPSEWSPGSG